MLRTITAGTYNSNDNENGNENGAEHNTTNNNIIHNNKAISRTRLHQCCFNRSITTSILNNNNNNQKQHEPQKLTTFLLFVVLVVVVFGTVLLLFHSHHRDDNIPPGGTTTISDSISRIRTTISGIDNNQDSDNEDYDGIDVPRIIQNVLKNSNNNNNNRTKSISCNTHNEYNYNSIDNSNQLREQQHAQNNNNGQLIALTIPREHSLEHFMEGPGLALYQQHQQQELHRNQQDSDNSYNIGLLNTPTVINTKTSTSTATTTTSYSTSTSTSSRTKVAACKFVIDDRGYSTHYPHAMQQLYSCFSYWYTMLPYGYSPFLISSPILQQQQQQAEETSETTTHNSKQKQKQSFLIGFIHALRDVFNVSTVRHRNGVPVVRTIVTYKYLHEVLTTTTTGSTYNNDNTYNNNNDNNDNTTNPRNVNPSLYHLGFQMTNPNAVRYLRDKIIEHYFLKQSQHHVHLSNNKNNNNEYSKGDNGDNDDVDENNDNNITRSNNNNHNQKRNLDASSMLSTRGCTTSSSGSTKIPPRITILNRLATSGRHIYNSAILRDIIYEYLLNKYNNNNISSSTADTTTKATTSPGRIIPHVTIVDSFDTSTFIEQVSIFAKTDIVLSPHGAQLTGIPFLSNCGGIIEIFPIGYYCPEFYSSLASVSGLYYDSIYTGIHFQNETSMYMKDLSTRDSARSFNLCIVDVTSSTTTNDNNANTNINTSTVHERNMIMMKKIIHSIHKMIQQWDQCCSTSKSSNTANVADLDEDNDEMETSTTKIETSLVVDPNYIPPQEPIQIVHEQIIIH